MKFLYENFLQFYLLALTSIIQHFYYQLDTSVVKSSLWIANNNNNQQTEINIYNNRIMWGMGRDYIFKKLEELQE